MPSIPRPNYGNPYYLGKKVAPDERRYPPPPKDDGPLDPSSCGYVLLFIAMAILMGYLAHIQ